MKCSLFIYSFFSAALFLSCPSFSLAQVNPQNGAAQVNIPLYSYSDPGNRLGLNASLDYKDGNGLPVSEMASSVGTGWVFDCGGVITRLQKGEPDDQQQNGAFSYTSSGYFTYLNNYYPNGYLYSGSYTASDIIDNGGGYSCYSQFVPSTPGFENYKLAPQYLADREQDVFSFSFNGRQGSFVIGKNMQARCLNDSKLKIDIQNTNMSASGIRTTISQFTVTDESGIQYIFKDLELEYACTYDDVFELRDNANIPVTPGLHSPSSSPTCPTCNDATLTLIRALPSSQFVVGKWYLSQIINPLTNTQISFNYSTYEEDINADKMIDYPKTSDGHGGVTMYWKKYKFRGKRLSSVVLSAAERIDLTYSSSPRIDLPNENALNRLQVSYNGNSVYSWNFNYGYFAGLENAIKMPGDSYTSTEQQWARLCLLSIQKTGTNNISEPPYKFGYNLGGDINVFLDVIPPMFSIFQDHYGYYNAGRFTNLASRAEPSVTSFFKIIDLQSLVFDQFSEYKLPFATVAKNGIIQSITYPLGGTLSFAYENNITSQSILGGVRVKTTTSYDGINHANDIIKQYNYVNADGTSSGWGGENYTYKISMPIIADNCGSTTGLTPAFVVKDIVSNYVETGFMTGSFGLASAAAFGSTLDGAVTGAFIAVAVFFIVELINQPSSSQTITVTQYNNSSTAANNPLPWGYARTEVVNLLGTGNIGKTVYAYSNPQDRAIDVPVMQVAYSSRPRYAPWVYGLPKSVSIYDNNGNLVKQTVNNYNFIVNTLIDPNFHSMSWTAVEEEVGCLLSIPPTTSSSYIAQEDYYPFTGHTELTSTNEYVFNTQQQSSVVTTNYEYDANLQLRHKYFSNSKGEKVETFYYHPYDYSTAPGAIATMNSTTRNIFSPVLSTETYINKSDGNAYLIGAANTDYDVFSNGDIKPKVTYTFQNPLPFLGTSLQPFNTSEVLRDPTYFKQTALFDYDNFGNLVQTVGSGNKVGSIIYDYDAKLVVALATNASYSDIGYTSFEAQGGKPGSWVNTAAIVSTDARTGNNSFNLSDPSNPPNNYFGFSGLNASLTYIVSYWGKSSAACINGSAAGVTTVTSCQGGSGWKQGATVNGWTYYEAQVNNLDKIKLSGTGLVDEFRIYPVGAQMTTTTYAPLLGKTSECDVSGRVTYYQYDDLGRLRFVLDDQKNIVKMYDYNYKQ